MRYNADNNAIFKSDARLLPTLFWQCDFQCVWDLYYFLLCSIFMVYVECWVFFSSVLTHLICEQSPWNKPSTIVFILKKRTDFFFHALMNEQVKAFAWEMDLWPKRCSPVPIKICSISLANGSLSHLAKALASCVFYWWDNFLF